MLRVLLPQGGVGKRIGDGGCLLEMACCVLTGSACGDCDQHVPS
jgi:hypothetical protein